jgi:dinuclear metal center YbgI/SA1388 family protein
MKHYRDEIEEKETEAPSGRREGGQQHENSYWNRADHPEKTRQFVTLVDMPQTGNDAQNHGYRIARLAFRGFGRTARPVTSIAACRVLWQQMSTVGARHFISRGCSGLSNRRVCIVYAHNTGYRKSQYARNSSSKHRWLSDWRLIQTTYNSVMRSLSEIVEYIDEYLRIPEIEDWPHALNGLQIENSGHVTKIGAAVDVSTRVLTKAAKKDVDLLIVHHGLFWPGLQPVTGALHKQLRFAFENNIALYSAHLPLDVHPKVGNNVQLAGSIGIRSVRPFFEEKGQLIGLKARASLSRGELVERLQKALGSSVKAFNFGPAKTNTIGIITGGAGSEIYKVAREKIDTFITGEAPHWAAVAAEELGINLLLGGHYATETFGVKTLAKHLSRRFKLALEFLDFPTGL